MRKKAEKKIRQAAAILGTSNFYRIDQVPANTALFRKGFDKTILDMAALGTILLFDGDTEGLSASETGDLISRRRTFCLLQLSGGAAKPENVEPETIDVTVKGIEREIWLRFEHLCETREQKQPVQKILDMINDYNRKADPGHLLSRRA